MIFTKKRNNTTQKTRPGGHLKMSVVKELIRTEADGGISFGDYELAAKA